MTPVDTTGRSAIYTRAQEGVISDIETAVFRILKRGTSSYKQLIIHVPDLLATNEFLMKVHNHALEQFRGVNLGSAHLCISKSGKSVYLHTQPGILERIFWIGAWGFAASCCNKQHLSMTQLL